MRLRSNIITTADVRKAFARARTENGADIYIDSIRSFKPRKFRHGTEFFAESLNGKVASAHGPITSGPRDHLPRAASWSDYGYLIAHLFNIDPDAEISFYKGVADFTAKVRQYQPRGQTTGFLDVLSTISDETLQDVARVQREWPDGVHTCAELQKLEPGRRPCTCGNCNCRIAVISHSRDSLEKVQRYLPSNYEATADGQGNITIAGQDVAGWTLDGYVIPRLASGLIFAKEVASR